MKHLLRLAFPILLLAGVTSEAVGQEFLADGSMKLSQLATDKEYGYKDDYAHSIKVGSPENIPAFLGALRGPRGEKVRFARIGSCCPYEWKEGPGGYGALARWQVSYEGLDQPITLYLNKNVYDNPRCPVGFTFKTAQDAQPPTVFPADSIRKVSACAGQPYAVEASMLRDKLAQTLPRPDKAPSFRGGPQALQDYFTAHPLTDPDARRLVFMVHLVVLVNCHGQAGNYQLAYSPSPQLTTYANQVLALVNRMPQQWQPAQKDGMPVDCYQLLSLAFGRGTPFNTAYQTETGSVSTAPKITTVKD